MKSNVIPSGPVSSTEGSVVYVPGVSMDTDRISPARFMKIPKYSDLAFASFHDERADMKKNGLVHPFDDPRNSDASILLVDTNFGCGSSRETAVQCLLYWGIRAVVGCSKPGSPAFADIFSGNAVANGIICAELEEKDHAQILAMMGENPAGSSIKIDLAEKTLSLTSVGGNAVFPFNIREDRRMALLNDRWDPMKVMMEAGKDAVLATANRLPHFNPEVLSTV